MSVAAAAISLASAPAIAGTGPISYSVADLTQDELTGGSNQALVMITISGDRPPNFFGQVSFDTAPIGTNPATQGAIGGGCPNGVDYARNALTLQWNEFTPASQIAPVDVCPDALHERNETFAVNLSNPTSNSGTASISDGQAIVTQTDDDVAPTVSIANTSWNEGNSGSTLVTFPVTLNTVSGVPASFTWAVSPTLGTATKGTSCTGTVDVTRATGQITIPAGSLAPASALQVPVCGDARDEANQTYFIVVSSPVDVTPPAANAQGTILDDDPLTDEDYVNDVTANQSTGRVTFTIRLTASAGVPVTVNYATGLSSAATRATGGTRCPPGNLTDFLSRTSSVTFPVESTTRTVNITVCNDTVDEFDQPFLLNLTSQTGAAGISDNQAIGTIQDNDAAPTLTLSASPSSVVEGQALTGTATLSSRTEIGTVTANFTQVNAGDSGAATRGTSCTAGVDFVTPVSVSIVAGLTSVSFSITTCNDAVDEVNELFILFPSNIVNASPPAGSMGGTITDND